MICPPLISDQRRFSLPAKIRFHMKHPEKNHPASQDDIFRSVYCCMEGFRVMAQRFEISTILFTAMLLS